MKSLKNMIGKLFTQPSQSRRRSANQPRVNSHELLEQRQVLSVSSIWMSGTTLVIKADNAPTNVTVSTSGTDLVIKEVGTTKNWTYRASGIRSVEFQGGRGNDRFVNYVRHLPVRAFGGDGNDYLEGYDGADDLIGGNGNDTLVGYGGDDRIWGGAGNDRINGGSGNDKLYGGSGDDAIYGGSGNDTLLGEDGIDKLFGEDGNDFLDGGSGVDEAYGGTGVDEAILSNAGEILESSEIASIRLPGGRIQQYNKCGPNAAWRVIYAYGGTAREQDIIDSASERSNISRWSMGTSGATLVRAMNDNLQGISDHKFSLKTESSFDTLLSHVKAGRPVVALISVGGTESVKVGPISYKIPVLHWVSVDGYDSTRNMITYTDPSNGLRWETSYSDFNRQFNWTASYPVRLFLQGMKVVTRTFIV